MLRSVREQDLRFWMEYFPPFSLITTHLYVGAPGISWYNSPQYSSTAPSYGMNKTSQLPPLQSFSWCRCCSWQFQVFGSCGSFIIPHVINTQRAVPIITIYIYIFYSLPLYFSSTLMSAFLTRATNMSSLGLYHHVHIYVIDVTKELKFSTWKEFLRSLRAFLWADLFSSIWRLSQTVEGKS